MFLKARQHLYSGKHVYVQLVSAHVYVYNSFHLIIQTVIHASYAKKLFCKIDFTKEKWLFYRIKHAIITALYACPGTMLIATIGSLMVIN